MALNWLTHIALTLFSLTQSFISLRQTVVVRSKKRFENRFLQNVGNKDY